MKYNRLKDAKTGEETAEIPLIFTIRNVQGLPDKALAKLVTGWMKKAIDGHPILVILSNDGYSYLGCTVDFRLT